MWTTENRGRYDRSKLRYPSDLTDAEWALIAPVEAEQGDVITVNPGEMHDGNPIHGQTRTWRMLYLDPDMLTRMLPDDVALDAQFARPALRDPALASRFARFFERLTAPIPDDFAVEEDVVRMMAHVMIRHGSDPRSPGCPPPHVTRARNRLDADDDAARSQQLIHHSQAEREAQVEPNRVADDLSREAVSRVIPVRGEPDSH